MPDRGFLGVYRWARPLRERFEKQSEGCEERKYQEMPNSGVFTRVRSCKSLFMQESFPQGRAMVGNRNMSKPLGSQLELNALGKQPHNKTAQ